MTATPGQQAHPDHAAIAAIAAARGYAYDRALRAWRVLPEHERDKWRQQAAEGQARR